jgi:O-antigen/teichoic acid export membrane protein
MSLKKKTVHGLSWSMADNVLALGIQFVVGILLARLLSPAEFGLVGMTAIFTAVGQSFVDSGFSSALIRKKACSQAEYSTVFYYNLAMGVALYAVLFTSAPLISRFFGEPRLTALVRAIGVGMVISAFTQIPRTRLIRDIDFKRQTVITSVSAAVAGAAGITLALRGWGVWSLVWLGIVGRLVETLLFWGSGRWLPSWVFSGAAFREMFGFGCKIMVSGLINTIYENTYYVIIGKYFSAADLGFYTRAKRFTDLIGPNWTGVLQRVTFPALSSIGEEIDRLRSSYRRVIMSATLISFTLTLGMAACARAMVIGLLGQRWAPCVLYLQLLCLVGLLYPLHALNLNMLMVKGRSDLFLRLEIYKKVLAIPAIVTGAVFGIVPMLIAMAALSLIAFLLNSYYSGRLIGYSTLAQIRDVWPSLRIAAAIALTMSAAGALRSPHPLAVLGIQAAVGGLAAAAVGLWSRLEAVREFRSILLPAVQRRMGAGRTRGSG